VVPVLVVPDADLPWPAPRWPVLLLLVPFLPVLFSPVLSWPVSAGSGSTARQPCGRDRRVRCCTGVARRTNRCASRAATGGSASSAGALIGDGVTGSVTGNGGGGVTGSEGVDTVPGGCRDSDVPGRSELPGDCSAAPPETAMAITTPPQTITAREVGSSSPGRRLPRG
jgi:hypothetical protein